MAASVGGSICHELCARGVPALAVTMADNPALIGRDLEAAQAAVHLGWRDQADESSIRAEVDEMLGDPGGLERIREAAWRLVDGLGATRVAQVLAA